MKFILLLYTVFVACLIIGGCLEARMKHPLSKEQFPSDTVPANCTWRFESKDGNKVCNHKEWI